MWKENLIKTPSFLLWFPEHPQSTKGHYIYVKGGVSSLFLQYFSGSVWNWYTLSLKEVVKNLKFHIELWHKHNTKRQVCKILVLVYMGTWIHSFLDLVVWKYLQTSKTFFSIFFEPIFLIPEYFLSPSSLLTKIWADGWKRCSRKRQHPLTSDHRLQKREEKGWEEEELRQTGS